MNDIIVRYINMPCYVKGQVVLDENGDYNIYINIKHSIETQRETLKHELNHIKNNDFTPDKPIQEIEGRCKYA